MTQLPSADALRPWLDAVEGQLTVRPVVDDSGMVSLDMANSSGPISLSGARTAGVQRVEFLNVGERTRECTLQFDRDVRLARVDCGRQLQELHLRGSAVGELEIVATRSKRRIKIDTADQEFKIGAMCLRAPHVLLSPVLKVQSRLSVTDTALHLEAPFSIPQLTVLGTFAVLDDTFRAAMTAVGGPAPEIRTDKDIWLGMVEMIAAKELRLDGPGVRLNALPPSTTIHSTVGQLFLEGKGPFERIKILGGMQIEIDAPLDEPTFAGQRLVVRNPRSILAAHGSVHLISASSGALIQGARAGDPMVVESVGVVDGAELEHVDIYSLTSPREAVALGGATRLVPILGGPLVARRRQAAMQFGTSDPQTRASRRANFWARLDVALRDQHAPGSVQSNVRLAEARSRRLSLSWRNDFRERFLLTLFSIIGYGERILLPVFWWLVAVTAGGVLLYNTGSAPDVSTWRSGEFVELLLRLLAAPLAIFRVEGLRPENGSGNWDTAVWIGAQLVGTLAVLFIVLVLRRITRLGTAGAT